MRQLFYSFMTMLVAVVAIFTSTEVFAQNGIVGDITYSLNDENKEAEIVSISDKEEITIPQTITIDNVTYKVAGFATDEQDMPLATAEKATTLIVQADLSFEELIKVFPVLSVIDIKSLDSDAELPLDIINSEKNFTVVAGDDWFFQLIQYGGGANIVHSIPDYTTEVASGVVELYGEDLMRFNSMVNGGAYKGNNEYTFKLIEDVYLEYGEMSELSYGYEGEIPSPHISWTADNAITLESNWTFDGQGHEIAFVKNDEMETVPLFSEVKSNATVKNLIISGSVKMTSSDNNKISPFVKTNSGTIERCVVVSLDVNNSNVIPLVGKCKECAVYNYTVEEELADFSLGEEAICIVSKDKDSYETEKSNLLNKNGFNRAAWTYYEPTEINNNTLFQLAKMKWEIDQILIPVMSNVDVKYDKATSKATFTLGNDNDWSDAINLIRDNYDDYANAIIQLSGDINFDSEDVDNLVSLEKKVVSGNKIEDVSWFYYWECLGLDDKPFKGTLDGKGHSLKNVVVDGYNESILGYLGTNSIVKDLSIENAAIILDGSDPDDMSKATDGEGKTKVFAPIIANKSEGSLQNISFIGNLYVDEYFAGEIAYKGYDLEWTPVSDKMPSTASIKNSLFYITNLADLEATVSDGSNKRNIIIMQNLGVGRNAGQTQKVCNNRKGKKSLSAGESADVNNSVREYTDEEMASGEPAYWLNYEGVGYSGVYSKKWSKGKSYPIMATSLSKPAVKIVYDIDGVTDDEAGLINPVFFANEDDEVEINVTNVPGRVWVGDGAKELNSASRLTKKLLSSACKNGIVTIHLQYGSATGIDKSGEDKSEPVISVSGQAIRITGCEGEKYGIVDIVGRTIAQGTAASQMKTVVVPSAGIYVVKVGDQTKKVVVK